MASESDNSKAVSKRAAPGSLMAPPPAPKRIKRPAVVLDEDTYVAALTHIIRRDFFPGLAETDAQMEYLNALESKDKSWIRESGKRLTEAMTPGPRERWRSGRGSRTPALGTRPGAGVQTPSVWGGATPASVAGTEASVDEEEKKKQQPAVDLTLSLTAFQAKYTPEDQESFNQILDRANAKKFLENRWLHDGNMHPSKRRLAQEKQKLIEASSNKSSSTTSSSQEVILRPSQDLDARPAAPNTHKHTAFNTLMFHPDSIESWAPTRAQEAQETSLAPPKALLHHNTRLPVPSASNTTNPKDPPSPTVSAIRDAIDGRPRASQSEAVFAGSETPRVNGYAFVDAVPPPEEEDDDAPEDLLERLGAKSEVSPFTIAESNRREKLHWSMVERIAEKRTGRTALGGAGLGLGGKDTPRFLSAPTPGGRGGAPVGPGAKGGLTPAGRRLLEKVGGATPKRG
ncbi:nuclear protein DGCR14, partial [Clohesyomyces aquaticus]